ncbi:hypothetical protein TR67_14695 [Pseudomonas deceptionensis]|nr:hypothetical protein TR67_14695 [Pseudomonas deceptionensis]
MIGSLYGLKGLIQSLWSIRRKVGSRVPFVDLSILVAGVDGEQRDKSIVLAPWMAKRMRTR